LSVRQLRIFRNADRSIRMKDSSVVVSIQKWSCGGVQAVIAQDWHKNRERAHGRGLTRAGKTLLPWSTAKHIALILLRTTLRTFKETKSKQTSR
jgi:hypothetical protein